MVPSTETVQGLHASTVTGNCPPPSRDDLQEPERGYEARMNAGSNDARGREQSVELLKPRIPRCWTNRALSRIRDRGVSEGWIFEEQDS